MFKHILAAAAALALAAPVAAQAQSVPSYAYAVQNDQEIHGRVTSFDGAYGLAVRDDNGYVDNVALHDGTIINPTGLELEPGMVVSILGYNAGNAFDANEIDTPYTFDDAVPYFSGHPWNYYGDSVDLSFFFGNTAWWHGNSRGVAYTDRGRDVTVVRDVTHVRDTAVRETPANQTPRQATPRYDSVSPRSNENAPRIRPAIATPRTFDNVPSQRTEERGTGETHQSEPARGRR